MFLRGHKANLSNAKLRFNSRSVWSVDRDEAINVVAPSSSHDKSLLSSLFFFLLSSLSSYRLDTFVARCIQRSSSDAIIFRKVSKVTFPGVARAAGCIRTRRITFDPVEDHEALWTVESLTGAKDRVSVRLFFSSSSFFSNFLLSLLRDCTRTEDWSERPMTCGNYALSLVHTRQKWNRRGKIQSSIGFNFVRECVLGEFTMGSSDTIRWKR